MIWDINFSLNLVLPFYILAFLISAVSSLFLYWRAGRHELYDSDFLLDLAFFSALGGIIVARIFAFLIDFNNFNFDIYRLIFFHKYPGFSFWGLITGILISGFWLLRKKKEKFLAIFDLVVAPIVFGQTLFFLFDFALKFWLIDELSLQLLVKFLFYLVFFITIKRLSSKKRDKGFFTGLYFVVIGVFSSLFLTATTFDILRLNIKNIIELLIAVSFAIFGAIVFYVFGKRRLVNDIKSVFAFILLAVFNFKRALTSSDEAGKISKSLIFLPYFILRVILVSLRILAKEVSRAFWELLYTLGFKKF